MSCLMDQGCNYSLVRVTFEQRLIERSNLSIKFIKQLELISNKMYISTSIDTPSRLVK